MTSDTVYEGKVAGEWLAKETGGKVQRGRAAGHGRLEPGDQPQEGLRSSRRRQSGHENHPDARSGDFTRTKGKEVMESFIKAEGGGKNICAVYAHNDDMAIGAIQAIKEAGLKPGKDIKIVSIDGVPDIFKAMVATAKPTSRSS